MYQSTRLGRDVVDFLALWLFGLTVIVFDYLAGVSW